MTQFKFAHCSKISHHLFMIKNVDVTKKELIARLHHHLKQRISQKSVLDPKVLENAICDAIGIKNIGEQELFADGYGDNYQVSIKTIKSKSNGNDNFQDNPEKHLGPFYVAEENIMKNGPEVVWRRQRVLNENDDPNIVGQYCLDELFKKCEESMSKLTVEKSYSLYVVHALDKDEKLYRISFYWEENKKPRQDHYDWSRDVVRKNSELVPDTKIRAYKNKNGNKTLEWIRIDGNVSRYATCLIELKNFLEFPEENQLHLTMVLPELNKFDSEQCVVEQTLLTQEYYRPQIEKARIMLEFFEFDDSQKVIKQSLFANELIDAL